MKPPLSRRGRANRLAIILVTGLLLTGGCRSGSSSDSTETRPDTTFQRAERLTPVIVSVRPHDRDAFTQGLVLYGDRSFESTGADRVSSTLREVDPRTGEVIRSLTLDDGMFAEGLERVHDRLILLTWQARQALVYDLESFEHLATLTYEGEAWGICFDGEMLVMTDGSDQLQLRDPVSFEEIAPRISVTLDGQPLVHLNELACADGAVWANVWLTDRVVRIDPTSGVVTAVADASALKRPRKAGVLNGIAYDPAAGTFLLTGKNWPRMYEVRFIGPDDP